MGIFADIKTVGMKSYEKSEYYEKLHQNKSTTELKKILNKTFTPSMNECYAIHKILSDRGEDTVY
jgi:hypothetical protein